MKRTGLWTCLLFSAYIIAIMAWCSQVSAQQPPNLIQQPYLLDTGLVTRSISFENPTGAPGEGGKAKSTLGVGLKGAALRYLKPGETVQLADIEGPGTIRHIWMTIDQKPELMRKLVIRGWWEGQEHPSIECPFGDFFGCTHGKVTGFQSAVHSVSSSGGMNFWLPMPFAKRAKFTITNESEEFVHLYIQITYTLGDKHPDDVGRMHVLFRRENPTTEGKDFEILPLRKNKGRYLGTVIGVRSLHKDLWWGEGEVKMFMDGDKDFATIVGTGTEDYVGLAWGLEKTAFLYNGCTLNEKNFFTIYRWHLPDPITWQKECRITMQQLAWPKEGVSYTSDDWCCSTFWYEPTPSEPLPKFPDMKARTTDIWKN
jgi:hypothetical protein